MPPDKLIKIANAIIKETGDEQLAVRIATQAINNSDKDILIEKINNMPDSVLFSAEYDVVCEILEIAKVSDESKIDAISLTLSQLLYRGFDSRGRKAINDAIKVFSKYKGKKYNVNTVNAILQPLSKALGSDFSNEYKKDILRAATSIYTTNKMKYAKKMSLNPTTSINDNFAINAISDDNLFWIGNHYKDNISQRMTDVVSDIVISQGLTYEETVPLLKEALASELGLVDIGDESWESIIPKKFNGNADDYFIGIASNIQSVASSFSVMNQLSEAGVQYYELQNPLDSRTSPICQFLDGMVFPIDQGMSIMNNYINSNTISGAKKALPFTSMKSISKRFGGVKTKSQFRSAGYTTIDLSGMNIGLPPFHWLCRTVAEIFLGTPDEGISLGLA